MFSSRINITSLTLLLTLVVSPVWGADASSSVKELRVFPPEVTLKTSRDLQRMLVQVVETNGLTRDVTAQAKYEIANGAFVKLEGQTLRPVADGSTELTVSYANQSVKVPVKVESAQIDRTISFKLDVMPVFMKAGCNMGSCHGAARGKDGFRLSLFGFDPDADYHRLTRELSGRRINLAIPEESLLVMKSVGGVPHTGGKRFDDKSEYNETLLRWLKAGAPKDAGETPKVTKVDIYPPNAVLDGPEATQQLTVRAHYADGTTRDVTSTALFQSSNDNSAVVEQSGLVTAGNRGEAFIMARFETHTVGAHFIVLPKGLQFQWPNVAENNYIDTHINNKLKKLRIVPSDLCTDEEFLRRVYLDVIGTLPTVSEYHSFMSDTNPKKREALVDSLLDRKEFVEMWVMKWAELLQIRTTRQVSYKAMLLYYNWLQERVANNVPMDKMVQELLSAKGGTFTSPATNYYQNESDTLKVAENVAQVFMGMRIQCAQCHNHPFDRWTMDDYYGFAAFFSQIGRKRGEDPREQIIYNRGSGDVRNPVGNRVAVPKFLGGDVPDVKGKDRREVLATWLASSENPYFATNLANIVWAHFFGRGIIHEVDDVRVSNPPVNPELIEDLGKKFTEYNYDFKKLVRDICTSRTYQLSTKTNESNASDLRNFSHANIRRMRAEVMLDCITQATDTQNKFQGLPTGARAVQIADGNTSTYFLTTFGRAKRESVCSCEVKMEPNLSQALHLLNGDTVNSKIQQGGLISKLTTAKKKPEEIIEEFYIRTLTRKPKEKEKQALLAILNTEGNDLAQTYYDVFWALMNSREFVFNH